MMLWFGLSSAIRQSASTDTEEKSEADALLKDVQNHERSLETSLEASEATAFFESAITENETFQAEDYIAEQDSAMMKPRPMCSCVEAYRGGDHRMEIDSCFWCRYTSLDGLVRKMCKQCDAGPGGSVYLESWQTCINCGHDITHCSPRGRDDERVWAKVGSTYGEMHYLNRFTCPSEAVTRVWSTVKSLLEPYRSDNSMKLMYMSFEPKARKYCDDYCDGGSATCTGIVLEHCRQFPFTTTTCHKSKIYKCKGELADQVACVEYAIDHNGVNYLSFLSCLA